MKYYTPGHFYENYATLTNRINNKYNAQFELNCTSITACSTYLKIYITDPQSLTPSLQSF